MKKLLFMFALLMSALAFTACSSDDDGGVIINKGLDTAQVKSSLIFKQVYFTGVPSYFWKDGFYELVNNGDTTVYLDGVVLGIVERGWGYSYTPVPSLWIENGEQRYPMYNVTAYFPGTGKDYPLAPGKNIVIATSALNWTVEHPTDTESGDVASPVNLEKADWEIAMGSLSTSDTDNPDVPNMLVAYKSMGLDFMPAANGQALMLAKFPNGKAVEDYAKDANNFSLAPGTIYPKYLMINPDKVIDVINIVSPIISERYQTVFVKDDEGFTFVNAGVDQGGQYMSAAYCGKALRRKVYKIVGNKVKYSDTNNSTKDFVTCDPIPWQVFTEIDK